MNNYWNHEPTFFLVQKKSQKKSGIFDSEVRPPHPRVDFWKKFLTSFFYGPYEKLLLGAKPPGKFCQNLGKFKIFLAG